ncbi:hypothetical protein ACMC56_02085 [Campylobacterota bacterium DY0563]
MQNHKILKKLFSSKGSMDKVLVALLFIVIGLLAIFGIESWTSDKRNNLLDKANSEYVNSLKK